MNRTRLFVVSLLGMAMSASALMLCIPSLFRPGEQGSFWVLGVLACLTVAFAVGTRYWRPSTLHPDGR